MHINYYLYQIRNFNAKNIYKIFNEIERNLRLKSKCFYFDYKLPPEEADHPGDFDSKKISRKKLEEGFDSGKITAFSMSNFASLNHPEIHIMDATSSDFGFGDISYLKIQFPESHANLIAAESIEALINYVNPVYGFQHKTENAVDGEGYMFDTGGDRAYRNESVGFQDGLRQRGATSITKARMLYHVNYLTNHQLDNEVNGVSLREFIHWHIGNNALVALGESVYKLTVDETDLVRLNDVFGRAGFLISWVDADAEKRERDEARRQRRGW